MAGVAAMVDDWEVEMHRQRRWVLATLAISACGTADPVHEDVAAQDEGVDGGTRRPEGSMHPAQEPSLHDAGEAPEKAGNEGVLPPPRSPQAPSAQALTTYTEHVRPILNRACLSCHAEGKIAPFTLEDYASARPLASRIAKVTRARTMPPSVIDASGDCNSFRDVSWLAEEEIATLEKWQADGAPEGDPSIPAPLAPMLPKLEGDVKTLRTPSYVPSTAQSDDYRCFVVDSPFTEDTYVTGYDTIPGDLKTAHHMVVFYPMDDFSAGLARLADEFEEGPGYTCFGSAGIPATVLAAWAPGAGATNLPDDLGFQVAAGRPLVIQMHYNTLGIPNPGADSTELHLEQRSTGVSPATFANMLDITFSAPPGKKQAEAIIHDTIATSSVIAAGPVKVYGMFPHMHELGRSIRVTFGDDESCMIDAPRYEFAWQRMYFLDKPIEVDAETPIKVRCIFDTSDRSEPVYWGEGTQEEMCVTGLIIKL